MIDKMVKTLKTLYPDIPVYGDEITEEERIHSLTYFIYRNSNRYKTAATGRGLLRELDLFFITFEDADVNIASVITELQKIMHFVSPSQEDFVKMEEVDRSAFMVTMTFSYPVRVC